MTPIATTPIAKKNFGTTFDGRLVDEYILTHPNGTAVAILTYGATVTRIIVPDKDGKLGDVALGFDNIKQYEFESPYFGSTIGRVGNRIAGGRFNVEGRTYCVPVNNGPNHLHGGHTGWDKRVWTAEASMSGGPSVRFSLVDPDGSEGYPGTVRASVIYTWTGDSLKIQYYATTDKTTPINLTNHTYFNLRDGGASPVHGHELKVFGDHYTPVDPTLIPTGEIAPVAGTGIDFREPKPIGRDLETFGGYDHNLVLRKPANEFGRAVSVYEPTTGRVMEVFTTEPGVQLYSGNFLDGTVRGKEGVSYGRHHALCLETQHFPDSVNQPSFPDSLLRPGEVYRQVTEYRFSVAGKRPF